MSTVSVSSSQTLPPREENPIKLVDRTAPSGTHTPGSLQHSATRSSTQSLSKGLSKRLTNPSIRGEWNRRKYAKWQNRDSVDGSGNPLGSKRKKLRRKRGPAATSTAVSNAEEVSEIDILYENQRGSFLFGIPLFSQNSLLNFDPSSWQNAKFKPSPVNITNAQVPDPSWEWAWKAWYVDMSHDVDEEGWEYSFSFQRKFSWHGTHPWFHSFVRRRRWLRKRVKRDPHHLHDHHHEHDKLHEAHELNADYFTIHTRRTSLSSDEEIDGALSEPAAREQLNRALELEEIQDIATLMTYLRKAAIDREKLAGVDQFLEHGGQERYFLSSKIPDIMSLFVFQESRQELLEHLMAKIDSACRHRDKHVENGIPESDQERLEIDGILAAAKIAEAQVKHLEYWSDMQDLAREGLDHASTDHLHGHDEAGEGSESLGIGTRDGEASKTWKGLKESAETLTEDTVVPSEETGLPKASRPSDVPDSTNGLSRFNTETIKEEPAREEKETRDAAA